MRISLSTIDKEQFLIKEGIIAGETCYLIQPHFIGTKWNKNNRHLRSSIWNSDGELVSAGFFKFWNWSEQPELADHPEALNKHGISLMTKIDGSALIFSNYKGELICRTRGTYSATSLENGHEIALLKEKFGALFELFSVPADYSIITEWTTPNNRIVLDYGPEPDLHLIGGIRHSDYSLFPQEVLDRLGELLNIKRPKRYKFETIPEMITAVEAFEGVEGICVYFNQEQEIRKLKGLKYLAAHRFKEHANIESVIDLFLEYNCPDYQTFIAKIEQAFDFECLQMVLPMCSLVVDSFEEVQKILASMRSLVVELKKPEITRKQAAEVIIQKYGQTNRASFVFHLLDGRELNKDQLKKLIFQCLKK